MVQQMGFDPDLVNDAFSPENVLSFSALAGATTLAAAPDIVKYQLLMPYLEGMKFSRAIVKQRKWKGLNQVLGNKPLSSEQILHPEKYLAGEKPQAVFTRFRPARGERVPPGVIGEYYLNVLLKQTAPRSPTAAVGLGRRPVHPLPRRRRPAAALGSRSGTRPPTRPLPCRFPPLPGSGSSASHFQDGGEPGRPFIAGNSGAGYFFLLRDGARLFYARSNDREAHQRANQRRYI